MAVWNPWRGCHKYSEGCTFCYIHKADARRGVNTGKIVKTEKFYAPVERKKNGEYKMKPGTVYLCFSSDFLIPEADEWRSECWKMIKERSDCRFIFLTKRIVRLGECLPEDWGDGYDNVTVGCTVENQERADERLPVFCSLPMKHRNIICQPMITPMNIEKYLRFAEAVLAGGESDRFGRELDYSWVLDLREQCVRQNVSFEFRQCATHFVKDGVRYQLQVKDLCSQAKKANINFTAGKSESFE